MKNTIYTREFYLIKEYTKVISYKGTDVYMHTDTKVKNPYIAMGFIGKQAKWNFHIAFPTKERRAEWVAKWEDRIKARDLEKQARKDRRQAPHTLQLGDVLYTSWGWEQTNIDFYQVTKLIGKKMVEIRRIAGTRDTEGMPYDQGKTMPIKDKFVDEEPLRKIASGTNAIRVNDYATAWMFDGLPKRYSTYA